MSNYIIRPVSMDLVSQHEPILADFLTPYKEYPFADVTWAGVTGSNARVPVAGGLLLPSGMRYQVVGPTHKGFVVKKLYEKDVHEQDPVLRDWGNYSEYNVFMMNDPTLQGWLDEKVCTLLPHEVKTTFRLRSLGPRRSDKFYSKISLWKSQKDRDEDRLTAMKPGRALSFMFPELEHKDIIKINDEYLKKFAPRDLTLHTSKDAEGFIKAYSGDQSNTENISTTYFRKSLSNSCMRYRFENLSSHPASSYASGDFTIAYTLDQEGYVASRCVIYDGGSGKPQAGPIYGVSEQSLDMIEEYLESIGSETEHNSSWEGAKLLRIEEDGGFLAPYIDLEPRQLKDTGCHLVISHYGEIEASNYSGILHGDAYNCCCCEGGVREEDAHYSEYTEEYYCEDCYYEEHFFCEYLSESVHNREGVECYISATNTILVAESFLETGDTFVLCEDGKYWHDMSVEWSEFRGAWLSPNDVENYFMSDWDSDWYPSELSCELNDGDTVSKTELDSDHRFWQQNKDGVWSEVKEELELDV